MIREAVEDDFSTIAAITNHYILTTSIHFAYEPLSPEAIRATWTHGRDRYPWVVADEAGVADDARVVGYAKAGVWRDRAAYRWTAEIGLYVADAARGRGLGRALYTALLAELTRRGFRSVIAGITLPNDPSIGLHRAFDFVSVGTVRDAGYKLGAWHDIEFWQKRLATDAAPPRAGGPPQGGPSPQGDADPCFAADRR
ncbi:MAG: phosphinothricin acetyltransferase [Deltaproteobacteria bacterium]|nr:phosphinothricin acetyltransferase [Deltaproteobacteria bacterium]